MLYDPPQRTSAAHDSAIETLLDEHLRLAADWDHEVGEQHGYDSVERRRVVLGHYARLPAGVAMLERLRDRDRHPELRDAIAEVLAERAPEQRAG